MSSESDPKVVDALVSLAARVDALTWVAGAFLDSHPHPATLLQAWQGRAADAADSGFEIEAPDYREKFLAELRLWTGTLKQAARRRASS